MPELPKVLSNGANWRNLVFYQKTEVLYQLTVVFCGRFLPAHGDRTVDQMVQAARSGKQNIVEGSEDGKTSTEMEIKLLNVARASIGELREDYQDYLTARHLTPWSRPHARFQPMVDFCKQHSRLADYQPFLESWSDEEMANVALTLCHQVDTMMNSYLKRQEERFVTEGGIKERMHAARTGYRKAQDQRLAELEASYPQLQAAYNALQAEHQALQAEHKALQAEHQALKAQYEALKEQYEALKGHR